jgi:hypothetical protein
VLAPRLNEIVLAAAPRGWHAADHAPASVADLHACAAGSGLVVWAGASDGTIFGAPAVNHAFRAWHDALHLATGAGFDPTAEVWLGRVQAAATARISGDLAADLVWLEVAGQALEYQRTGRFVMDQLAWTLAQLRRGVRV